MPYPATIHETQYIGLRPNTAAMYPVPVPLVDRRRLRGNLGRAVIQGQANEATKR